jgi:hypothetical protein
MDERRKRNYALLTTRVILIRHSWISALAKLKSSRQNARTKISILQKRLNYYSLEKWCNHQNNMWKLVRP